MNKPNDAIRPLLLIEKEAMAIVDILKEETYDSFIYPKSERLQNVILWKLFIIGECAGEIKHKWPDIQIRYPTFPLKALIGMNKYLKNCKYLLDLPVVWTTIQNKFEDMIDMCQDICRDIY